MISTPWAVQPDIYGRNGWADHSAPNRSKLAGTKSCLNALNRNRDDAEGLERKRKRFGADRKGVEGAAIELGEAPDCFSDFTLNHVPPNEVHSRPGRLRPGPSSCEG